MLEKPKILSDGIKAKVVTIPDHILHANYQYWIYQCPRCKQWYHSDEGAFFCGCDEN